MDELKTNDYLKGIVLNLPESPGIYQYLNAEGTIIYVGKAKNLKRRVSSYFNREHEPGKTRVLVSKIADIRYIVVQHGRGCLAAGEQSYQEIQTPLQRTAERRQDLPVHLRAERIFSPRIQDAANHTQQFFLLRPVQPHTIHVCSARPHQAFVPATHLQLESLARKHPAGKFNVCLEYHIKNCAGPCIGKQNQEEYLKNIAEIKEISREIPRR